MRSRLAVVIALSLASVSVAAPGSDGRERPTRAPGTHFRDCRDCPEMVVIPAGRFIMGSPTSEEGRFDNEGPQHPVDIPRAFAIGVYDVTRTEYARFARETGREPGEACRAWNGKELPMTQGRTWRAPGFPQTDRDPVVCVTWDDAKAFVAWLNLRSGAGAGRYRLLTEAEWEYAARAGTTTAFYWGEHMTRAKANYGPDEPHFAPVAEGPDRWGYTSPVGSFPANPWGLFDMAGNVWQWTEDCWHAGYVGAPADGSVWTDGACDARVVRGGSWFKPPSGERPAKRGPIQPDIRNTEVGFRVARSLA